MANFGLCFLHSAPEVSPHFVSEMARKIEEAGLHSFWANDRIAYDNLEPVTAIMAAAAVTRRIKIGTSILLVALRHPVLMAKTLATVDFLSEGRLILGVGLGNRKNDYDAVGVPFEKRGTRTAEEIQLIKKVWRDKQVTHQGRFYHASNLTIGPGPIQSPHPPVWIGGSAEAVLRRVARLGDGYLCGTSALQRFPELWEKICAYTAETGRDPAKIEKAGLTFIAIDDDKRRAVAACEAYLQRYYGKVSVDVEAQMVVGPGAACAERIATILKQGINTLILGLIIPDLRQIDLLSEKILPGL